MRVMVIIVGSFWQVRVLAMSIMAVGVVEGMSVVLVVVGVVGVVVDWVVISTEITLERHVVVVVVACVGSDDGLEVNTGSDRGKGAEGEAWRKVTVGAENASTNVLMPS